MLVVGFNTLCNGKAEGTSAGSSQVQAVGQVAMLSSCL
jgi:hypothetical protein